MPSRRSDQIDDREKDDPHEIDEMPVEPDVLDPLMIVLRVLPAESLDRHERHADHPAEDVKSVESRRREEDRAEEALRGGEVLDEQEVAVFEDLHREERGADQARGD